MSYCLKCGAYIPDGQTVCLACNYDPAAEQKAKKGAAASSAARQQNSNEDLRRRLEEQRKRTQEQNRQWAEQERIRREEQAEREAARRAQQEENRRWAQEEYERRQAEQRSRAYDPDRTYRATTENSSYGTSSGEGNKALAAVSYLSILFALPFIFTPNDEYAKYHAKQGLRVFIFGLIADALASIIGFGWIATLARLYLIYKGMSNALNGKKEPVPYIGTLGEK
ncbi:MAG: hypothetical protein IJQ02_13650 [Oscillospiraceae bacterium]|nr:hypothetical protein [Oscillospiraceae bacterium]MBR0392426.1 hypothetical protein [Oscillospiraceae bacterium]